MYVRRDAQERIDQVSRDRTETCTEAIEADSPELAAFLKGDAATGGTEFSVSEPDASEPGLAASDLELVRVLEDLIEVLMDKGVLRFTDLPEAAQKKLLLRKDLRASAQRLSWTEDDESLL